jgi:hypothetical protein
VKALGMFFLLAIGVGNASVGHAIEFGSQVTPWCVVQNKTYACGEAFTSISISEVSLFKTIKVEATFSGSGYVETDSAAKQVVGWNPSTRNVKVKLTPYHCAHRGTHAVDRAIRFSSR